jgi:hypothetical protein
MAKKKTEVSVDRGKQEPEIVVLYVELDKRLKEAMADIARRHHRRLTGEVIVALEDYVRRHSTEGSEK